MLRALDVSLSITRHTIAPYHLEKAIKSPHTPTRDFFPELTSLLTIQASNFIMLKQT